MKASQRTVLIVDNNAEILALLQTLFENAGFDTAATWSGAEALDLLKTGKFRVLLADDYLPSLHPNDFLSQVAALPVRPWIVVMQAAVPAAGDLRRYGSLGAAAVVPKYDFSQVYRAVLSCCSEQPPARPAAECFRAQAAADQDNAPGSPPAEKALHAA